MLGHVYTEVEHPLSFRRLGLALIGSLVLRGVIVTNEIKSITCWQMQLKGSGAGS